MSEFKVGDRVKRVNCSFRQYGKLFDIGDVGIIKKIYSYSSIDVYCEKKESEFNVMGENLELVKEKEMKKSDLKERWLVKFSNGQEAMLNGLSFKIFENGLFNGETIPLNAFTEDLKYIGQRLCYYDLKVVEVYKPHYSKVWERKEEPVKEMTISEIKKQLGISEDTEFKIKEE